MAEGKVNQVMPGYGPTDDMDVYQMLLRMLLSSQLLPWLACQRCPAPAAV